MKNKFIVDKNVSVLSMNGSILLLKSRIPSDLREEGVQEFINILKTYINVSKGEFLTKRDSPLYYLFDDKEEIPTKEVLKMFHEFLKEYNDVQ